MEACDCCRLGLFDGEEPYILPMNFGYAYEAEKQALVLYFHCAPEGKKLTLAKERSRVGFEMDTGHQLIEDRRACGYSFHYRSIIGGGEVSFLEQEADKREALKRIMAHYSGRSDWTFPPEAIGRVTILKLTVTHWSCKER